MSQPKGKTNFRTYEAAIRLLAAVIATANPKLDYNEIAKHVSNNVGVDAINHRFRPIKQLAKMQAECVKKGEDPGALPTDKGALAANFGADATAVGLQHRLRPIIQLAKLQLDYRKKGKDPGELPTEKGEIQKLFGESTPGGIEWQFGSIKRLGKAQQEAVKKGENPATLMAPGTPSAGRRRGRPAATPGSGSTAKTPGTSTGTGTGRKRKGLAPLDSSDDNDSDFVETPSNRPSKRASTASAMKKNGGQSTPTAFSANAVTSNPATTMISGVAPIPMSRAFPTNAVPGNPATTMSSGLAPVPTPRASIFGGDAHAPITRQSAESFDDDIKTSGGFGTQHDDWRPPPQAPFIKNESVVGANSFISSVNSFNSGTYYDEEYDDGVV
ncbi:hypothetical protein F4679DRAFT_583145 [Xylaria curta]|nr:hypothetical protein F4679DRAFT_583145 [Xylaria curta]